MKISKIMVNTLREVPAEAEIISHQLLLRANFIRKTASGIYTYMPLGWIVMKKIMNIIREEMDKAGGLELSMPAIHPAELWQESGRWEIYGDELFRLQDRHKRNFCLGPTHEEIITDIVRKEVSSYKQLPLLLYQIQNKYRDERRPRFGLMRGREFLMKDLYSFDIDHQGMEKNYVIMHDAYTSVFERCGLTFRAVEADTGAIGGNTSHEFMVLADNGEQEIVFCSKCDYAANVEKAAAKPDIAKKEPQEDIIKKHTPGMKSIDDVADYLNIPIKKTIKAMLYNVDDELVCLLIRGDRNINDVKVKNELGALNISIAEEDFIHSKVRQLPLGYVGPVGLKNKIQVIADLEIQSLSNVVAGANEEDFHFINVNPDRDFVVDLYADIRMVEENEKCNKCEGVLNKARGIEVGQIFQLGTKYSESLNAYYTDEEGNSKPIIMGCYGIGVGRTMAAAVEQNNDEDGIVWPLSIAPFSVVIVPISIKDEQQKHLAETVYQELKENNIEVVLDDRNERAGVKFKDADLIGYPLRIVVGKKATNEGLLEVIIRKNREQFLIETEKILKFVGDCLEQ